MQSHHTLHTPATGTPGKLHICPPDYVGPLLIFASACGFGLNPLFVQLLAQQGFDTLTITLYRFAIPTLICAVFLPVSAAYRPEAIRMLGLGVVNATGALCYFNALQNLPVSLAILIYYTYPAFCVLFGWLIWRKRPCRNAVLSALLILIAVSLVATPDNLYNASGELPVLALLTCAIAPVTFALQIQYLAAPIQQLGARKRIAWSSLGHMLILIPISLLITPEKFLPESLTDVYALAGITIIAAVIPQFFFVNGVSRTPAEKVAVIGASELIVAMLTGTWFMQQPMGQPEVTAMLLICIALMIRTRHMTRSH